MPSNVEIKARAADFKRQSSLAASLSDAPPVVIEQMDTFFACPSGRLKLRRFADGAAELIAYRRADDTGPKQSDYVIAPVSAPEALAEALGRSLGVIGTVRKRRTLFIVGQTRIHLDEVDGLGQFIELEVVLDERQSADVGNAIARELMRNLDIDAGDLISGAYIDMMK